MLEVLYRLLSRGCKEKRGFSRTRVSNNKGTQNHLAFIDLETGIQRLRNANL